MKRFSVIISLLCIFLRNVSAEPAIIELVDGTFGKTEIIDTAAIRDTSVTEIEVAVNGVISKIGKERISFIVFNNDTILLRDITSGMELFPDAKDAQFRFGRKRKIWLSGNFGFTTMNIQGLDAKEKMLFVNPSIRFFLTQDFFIGPRLQWTGAYGPVSSINDIGTGMDLGVLATGDKPVVFYFRTGFLLNVQQYKSELYELEPGYAYGVSWPLGVGAFIRVSPDLYLQVEPGYQIKVSENSTVNNFSLSIGFAVAGRKYCVSTLHTLTNVYY